MGKRNRQRRAQKQRASGRARPHRRQPEAPSADELVWFAVASLQHGAADDAAVSIARLAQAPPEMAASVDGALAGGLERVVRLAWEAGWQPLDLQRIAARRMGAAHARLVVDAIAAQARSYAAVAVDPRWQAQLDALGANVLPVAGSSWVAARARRDGSSREVAITVGVELLSLLATLPHIEVHIPPPGTLVSPRARHRPAGVDVKMFERVRALLAKAESTTFPEEADALTAKAQELMARHAIDRALLDGAEAQRDAPTARRMGLDDPYMKAKAMLLSRVADANRCRAVFSSDLGFSTLFGFEPDMDVVEMLYTSLLVQATRAMTRAGGRGRSGGGVRSFRQSFLVSYGLRIGERLRDATAAATAEAAETHGERLLPVLASRKAEVDEAFAAAFPNLGKFRAAANDHDGWVAGRAAADLADLNVRQEVGRRSA